MPNAIAISLDAHLARRRFITSTGHGEPAMIPVRSEPRS